MFLKILYIANWTNKWFYLKITYNIFLHSITIENKTTLVKRIIIIFCGFLFLLIVDSNLLCQRLL